METLPPEILLEILSHLPYHDLKHLQRTSHQFQTLISIHPSSSLSRTLFRDKLQTLEPDHINTIFTLHPIFSHVIYTLSSSNPYSITIPPSNVPLIESNVRYENATSPAVSSLTVTFRYDWRAVVTPGQKGKGVSVWDVMRCFAEDVLGFIERNAGDAMPKKGKGWMGFEHWEFVGDKLLLHVRDPEEDDWEENEEEEWEGEEE